jgi:hypothetical protein
MSEVARLREQIEKEADALRFLSTGFKSTASHQIIEKAYDNLGRMQERLGQLIGEGAAVRVVISALGGPAFPDGPTPFSITLDPCIENRGVVEKAIEAHGGRLDAEELFLPLGTLMKPVVPDTEAAAAARYTILFPDGFMIWLRVDHEGRNLLTLNKKDLECPTCGKRRD